MLSIEGLTAGYSAIPVLNDVSLEVEDGQFVAIVGPNGAGKTTLFKTISGIVRPSAGIDHLRGPRPAVDPAGATRPSRHRPCARRTSGFPVAHGDGKPRNGREDRSRPARLEANIERIFEWLPVLAERRGSSRARCRAAAADARHRPGLGLLAEASDARRALDGPRARHRGFHLRTADRDPPQSN